MNDRFKYAMKFVSKWEGGKVDIEGDRGGRTAYGITQHVYDKYRIDNGKPTQDVWDILPDDVHGIYWQQYWRAAKCDLLPDPLDLVVFDSAVQHGPARSIKWLQTVLGVSADAIFGPRSIQALQDDVAAGMTDAIVAAFISTREQFYKDIISRDSSQLRFQRGWGNRMAALKLEVNELA